MRPYEGRKKVFILAEADRMNRHTANALLKTLEEPPGHVLMILTSARFGKLPSTVMSRCQQVRFTPLSREEVRQGLERLSLGDTESRQLASRLAQGDLRRAIALLGEDIHRGRQETFKMLSATLGQDFAAILRWSQKLGKARDRADSRRRLQALQVWYRDLMLLREGHRNDLINADYIPQLSDLSSRYDWNGIQRCLRDIRESFRALDAHVNQELIWITLLSRLKRHRKKTA
jgi:DNA polymerase-3 subunit delta'